MEKVKLCSLFFLLFFFGIVCKACAYIDPGTGSYILQMLIAGAVGSLFAIKMFWRNIKNFFGNLFKKKVPVKDSEPAEQITERGGEIKEEG